MSCCFVCRETPRSPRQLCAVANCNSAVCYLCALALIQHGIINCGLCKTPYNSSMVDAFAIAADAAGAVVNVRDAFHETDAHEEPEGSRRVRPRRLFTEVNMDDDYHFIINGMLNFPEVLRHCTEILSFQYSVRWDTTTQERRFLIVNGFPNDRFGPQLVRTGFTTHVGTVMLGQRYYCSSNPRHLPPIMFGPLFLNDRNLIPDQFRQAFDECKFFYMRDQLVRNYNPWYYGHRPWSGLRTRNPSVDTTDAYTDAIKVSGQWPYILWSNNDRALFLSLAFDWCVQAKVLPRVRLLQQYSGSGKFYDISPVHCSRLRIMPDLNYREFDCACMLSIRKDDTRDAPWRSGMFLFFKFKNVNQSWSIAEDSCALSPNANMPRVTISSPLDSRIAHTSLLSFCRRLV